MPSITSLNRPFEELPRRRQIFVEQYVLSGDVLQAYLAAGYKKSANSLQKALQYRSQMREHIVKKTRELAESTDMAILGMKTVRELAINADSEAVRLQAGKELMARALPEAPKEVTHNHTHEIRNLTDEEIDKRIARLAGDLAIDVTPEKISITE